MCSTPLKAVVILVATAAVSLTTPSAVTAGAVVNGDFADPVPLFGWDATGTILGEPTDEFGQLGFLE